MTTPDRTNEQLRNLHRLPTPAPEWEERYRYTDFAMI